MSDCNSDIYLSNEYDLQRLCETSKIETPLLFQKNPPENKTHEKIVFSWTNSLESYQFSAWKEVCLLLSNTRRANHEIVLGYQIELSPFLIMFVWSELRKILSKRGIVAYVVIEITRNKYRNRPINRVHYHFLIDSSLKKEELEGIFRTACKRVGFNEKEVTIKYDSIDDEKTFRRRVFYILKYNRPWRVILFQPKKRLGTQINKIYQFGGWFESEGGKTKMWKNGHKSPIAKKTAPVSIEPGDCTITLTISVILQIHTETGMRSIQVPVNIKVPKKFLRNEGKFHIRLEMRLSVDGQVLSLSTSPV